MPFAQLGDLRMAYDLHGPDAPPPGRLPVLFVMGFGLSGRVWRFVLPEVPDRRLVTFDNRGAGQTDAPRGPYRMAQLARDALALMDHLGLGRVHLVGVSMGGMVAQEMALADTARFASLTLIATHPGGPAHRLPPPAGIWHFLGANFARSQQRRLDAVARLLFPKAFRTEIGPEWLHRVLAEDFTPPAPAAGRKGQLAAVMRHDTRRRLPSLAGLPTLVIKPLQDKLVAPSGSDRLARMIPGARKLELPDAGHGLIRQKASTLGEALRAHFAAAEAG
ncbi:MAG: alpha/beta fold hydrolase [Deltaproteobacteria bacterium]|nr:alpha/beta fold hydrolase [Deltaproteobacteria bacterium]